MIRPDCQTGSTAPESAPPTSAVSRSGRGGLLRERDYRSWFFAQILSSAGLQTQNIGAAWLVYLQTHSGLALALLIVAGQGPGLLLSLFTGTVVDRLGPRAVLLCTQIAALVASGSLGVITLASGAPDVRIIYALTFVAGVITAFDGPARQLIVVQYVGREHLPQAIGLYEVSLSLARMTGPAIGGVLLGTLGPAVCFLVNAITYLPPALVLLRYPPRFSPPRHAAAPRRRVRDAVRVALRSPPIRSCLLLAVVSTTLVSTTSYFPQFASESLHLPSAGYGALVACLGVGSLPGAILASKLGRRDRGRRVVFAAAATGLATLITGLGPAALAFPGAVLCGMCSICLIALANTVTQLASPDDLRGGIMGAWTMVMPGMGPITGIGVGSIADHWGPRWSFVVIAICFTACAAACWRPLNRTGDRTEP